MGSIILTIDQKNIVKGGLSVAHSIRSKNSHALSKKVVTKSHRVARSFGFLKNTKNANKSEIIRGKR
jgi:hypothetical protein